MAAVHYDDAAGWQWWYDDTNAASKAILVRVVRASGVITEVDFPTDAQWVAATGVHLTSIAANCFNDAEGHKMTKVLSMPSTITTIGTNAFKLCNLLTSVTCGSGVTTFGTSVFESAGLTSFTFPNSAITFGTSVFEACTALTQVTFGTGMTQLPGYIFYGCTHLVSITFPNTITSTVTDCCEGCTGLTTVTFGNAVTAIGARVFKNCTSLASITFLSLVAPASAGADWILNVPVGCRGHALVASNFPAPGNAWNGLTMGNYYNPYPAAAVWTSDTAKTSDDPTAWDVAQAIGTNTDISFTSAHVGACTINQTLALGTCTLGAGCGPVTFSESCSTKGLSNGAGDAITIATTKVLTVQLYSGYTYLNSGKILGQGTSKVVFELNDAAMALVPGELICAVDVSLLSTAAASRILTLGTPLVASGAVNIASAHASNTITADLIGLAVEGSAVNQGARGIVSSSVAGAKVKAGTGGVTVAANGSLDRTNISLIKSCGPVDTSAGSTTTGTDKLVMCGDAQALKMAAGQTLYDVVFSGQATSLGSDITVSNECVNPDAVRLNGHALTITDKKKRYMGGMLKPVLEGSVLDPLRPDDLWINRWYRSNKGG